MVPNILGRLSATVFWACRFAMPARGVVRRALTRNRCQGLHRNRENEQRVNRSHSSHVYNFTAVDSGKQSCGD